MKNLLVLISLLLFMACGKHEPKSPLAFDKKDLMAKHANYLEISSKRTKDIQRWHSDGCDSLLFSSLVAYFIDIDIEQAYYDGSWHRRPEFMGECWPEYSGSTISRDMLIGVFWWAWKTERLDIFQALWDHGQANGWQFGEGDPARIYMSAQMIGTLALAINILGGDDHLDQAFIPLVLFDETAGYQAHLGVLHALLRADMYGFARGYYIDFFKAQADRVPANSLFQYAVSKYATGDYSAPVGQLMNPAVWPDTGIDTNVRCEPWMWQRDKWEACPDQPKQHSGYDFLFLSNLILGEL